MVFLQINDLMKLYKIENSELQIPALRGINLTFENPELVSIIGPSGSGKSTLLKLIAGLDNPSSGSIELEGKIIQSLKGNKMMKFRQETIGLMYQFPERNLLAHMSAFDNVMFPMRVLGKKSLSDMKKRATELLKAVDVYKNKQQSLGKLSGGEAQRVAIAVSLANKPSLILADEPTGELDSENTFKIIEYFKEIHQAYGTGFIVVTHDERFSNLTKNTYKIQDGRIVGIHRFKQIDNNGSEVQMREHLNLIDKTGHIKLPDEIIQRINTNEVTFKINESTGAIEIIPIKKSDLKGNAK